MKQSLLAIWIIVLFTGMCYLFWHEDWKYSLPTPVPAKYHDVKPGSLISIADKITPTGKPLFLHFFNPTCPCSRFNVPQFRTLVRKYGDRISFAVVVLSKDTDYTEKMICDKFDLDIPVFFNPSIADSCGVYSTPQAVIIGVNQKLYYRGNYNKSRYCSDKKTNFAQMAIDSLLNNSMNSVTNAAALRSYGCSLPYCKK